MPQAEPGRTQLIFLTSLSMPQGQGRLHALASEGDVAGVAAALAAGARVDERDAPDGCTPLHWAADRGHTEVRSPSGTGCGTLLGGS